MPAMLLSFFQAKVRRLSNSASHVLRWSCGPVSAATAPFCANEVGLLVLWLCTASIALAIGSGAAHQPSRQPVMLHALAKPCTTMVCSQCAGEKLATLWCAAPS